MYTVIKIVFICNIIILSNSWPIGNKCQELNENGEMHGIILEDNISPNNVYSQPDFVVPLIIEDASGGIHLTVPNPKNCGHVGYVHAGQIQGKLMPVHEFNERFTLPENIKLKKMDDGCIMFDTPH